MPTSPFRSTDLTKVQDHPAAILHRLSATKTYDGHLHLINAALELEQYEKQHNVTFAALDNDALTAVREAYEEVAAMGRMTDPDHRLLALKGLHDVVGDLLGLGD